MTFLFQLLFVLVQVSTQDKWWQVLKLYWSDFHLSSLGGVVMSFPRIPIDSISIWRVLPMTINTIQVWCVTSSEPPGSFVFHSTVTARDVIVLIFGWEGKTPMPREGITCSTWKKRREKSEGQEITIGGDRTLRLHWRLTQSLYDKLRQTYLLSKVRYENKDVTSITTEYMIPLFVKKMIKCLNYWKPVGINPNVGIWPAQDPCLLSRGDLKK